MFSNIFNFNKNKKPAAEQITTFEDLQSVPFQGEQEQAPRSSALQITEFAEQDPDNHALHALVNFLNTDLRAKTELLALAPRPEHDADESARIDYVDKLDDELKSLRLDFKQINQDFGFDDQTTEDFFRARRAALALGKYDAGTPQKLFQQEFSNMRPEFIEEVKRHSVGYSLFGANAASLASQASTVNELLHAYHSHIMNTESILQTVPPLAERKMANGYPVTLRGESSPAAREILESLPEDLDIGYTDIVAAGGHILMMVRDRGHALTINIARGEKNYELNYHIPKICNQKMVAALPGIGKITRDGANGAFDIPYDAKLGDAVADFISRIPTDDDMETS